MATTTAPLDLLEGRDDLPHLRKLLEQPCLMPLLPLLYLAWSNGELQARELELLKELTARLPWVDEDALQALDHWLDPAAPPEPVEITALLQVLREGTKELGEAERLTLAELGADMAALYKANGPDQPWTADEIKTALSEIEEALGLVGEEAAGELRTQIDERRPEPPARTPEPTFDVLAMRDLLDGSHQQLRNDLRRLLDSDRFLFHYGLPLDDYREQVVSWLTILAEEGFSERAFPRGEHRDMSEFLAIFETLGIFDLSLLVKFGVQLGLFGGSILFLGTERHHKFLDDVASLKLQGCYAMTELGRGSNVRELETIARYDSDTEEFVIHTPTESARKEWIGGAGKYATMATVYAQLIVDGENHGVHAFLVPIRDDNREPLEGVRIEDQGWKMGLNGVDNGRIWFDHVRVPRENLLDRYGQVDEEGRYQSTIPSANRRFFTTLSTLVAGRLGITASGLSAAKVALTIATRYGSFRRQFGPAGKPEIPLLEYRTHQRTLMPLLASAYAQTFALHRLMDTYNDPALDDRRVVEATAAGMKAYSSWFAIDAVQESREACGGQGYLSLNRLPQIRADVDVFATFEGANVVMMQQVAKATLSEFGREMADGNLFTMARMLTNQATRTIAETNPVVTRNTDPDHLRSSEFQLNAFTYRENTLKVSLARRMKRRLDDGMDSFQAFNECQDHAVALANANLERYILESFIEAEEKTPNLTLRDILARVRALYALSRVEADGAWFLENGYLQGNKYRAIRDEVNLLCAEVREHALSLTDAFGIPDSCISAPIAFADQKAPAEARHRFARGVAD